MENCVFRTIREKQVSVIVFREYLAGLFLENEFLEHREFFEKVKVEICGSPTVEDIWSNLCVYWNYFNFSLLDHLVANFGDKALTADMEEYKKAIQSFRGSHLRDFADKKNFPEENWKQLAFQLG